MGAGAETGSGFAIGHHRRSGVARRAGDDMGDTLIGLDLDRQPRLSTAAHSTPPSSRRR